jgi:magnesium-transporting ATPase (P-type)
VPSLALDALSNGSSSSNNNNNSNNNNIADSSSAAGASNNNNNNNNNDNNNSINPNALQNLPSDFAFECGQFLHALRTAPITLHAQLRDFLRVLAVCNSVLPSRRESDNTLEYQAASPDEAALVSAARHLGCVRPACWRASTCSR